jgi:hypothetical protein
MSELSARQRRSIPFILASPTITEGVSKAGITTKTFYQWLEQPAFKAELDHKRNEAAKLAFDTLTQNLTKAVENLVALLDHSDDRLKRLACKDVIEYILDHKANESMVRRIEAIEQRLAEKRN